jgi:hypothetical protein
MSTFVSDRHGSSVLKLRKALYGLRLAPRAWNAKPDDSLRSLGFEQCQKEHALYRCGQADSFLLIGVYVDDLVITKDTIRGFKGQMHNLFCMSDLGLLSYYLGIEVEQKKGVINLCQASYAQKIHKTAGMQDCNPSHTPMDIRLKIGKHNGGDAVDAKILVPDRKKIPRGVGIVGYRGYWKIPSGYQMNLKSKI